ncbi:MAG: flagellar biosynthetic protein FliO [Terracidiphilus sp.]|jgi:hypothetical protein
MIEKQPKSYAPYQPPRERLAYLLAQLSELDPEPVKKLKLEPVPVKKLILEHMPTRKPVRKAKPELELERNLDKRQRAARTATQKAKPNSTKARKPNKKLKPELKPDRNAFHAVLRESAKSQVGENWNQRRAESIFKPWLGMAPRGPLSGLARIWSWLHSKYTKSAGKRLRLSEVVSLGDKRFVALVKVEDREFLVGGAASGLSLLAQLEQASEPAHGRKRGIGAGGRSL